jgi:predicted phosphate transport protein (TIGR00153 family)
VRLFRRSVSLDNGLLSLLEEAGRNAERAASLLHEMLADFPERSELARDVLLCEQEGDRITHDLIHRLSLNGARLGVERGDAHALAVALDDVVDHAEEAADYLGLYGIEAPMEQAEELSNVLVRSTAALTRAIGSLRGSSDLATHLVEIHQLENEGDRVSRDAIAALFKGHIDPMVVIRWKDVFESLEQAIDSSETAAHIIEGIELKRHR